MNESRGIRRLPLAAAAVAVLAGGLVLPAQTAFATPHKGPVVARTKPWPKGAYQRMARVNKCNFIHWGDIGKTGVDPKDYYDCYPPH